MIRWHSWWTAESAGWEEGFGWDWEPGGQTGLGGSRSRGSKDDKAWMKDSMPQNSQGSGTARLRT